MQRKRVLALVLILCMLFSMIPVHAVGTDVYGHWAQEDMTYLNTLKIMEGYPDGTYKPNNDVTKAEFIKLMNRTFSLNRASSINYSDVSSAKWYYPEIQRAYAAGYMFTFSQKVRPELALTREEAAAMFGKLLGLYSTASSTFADASSISSWALPYVTAVAEARIIEGYPDGSFAPKDTISRAEAARIICNTIGNYYNTAGTYSDSADGNVTVVANGVTLRNMTIPGNLYICEGVGYGTVTLDNVIVQGKILTVGATSAKLVLKGANTKVNVASNVSVQVASSINSLTVSTSKSVNVSVAENAVVTLMTLNGPANVSGAGIVASAAINVNGTVFAARPRQWTLASGVGTTLAGSYTTTSGTSNEGFASGYPKATIKTTALNTVTIEVTAKVTKRSNLYYIAVVSGSSQPTAQQIKFMQSSGNLTVLKGNYTQVNDVNAEVVATLSGLPYGQNYDVWLVTEDLSTGTLGAPVKVTPTTPIFAQDPFVQDVGDTTATIAVKLSKAATVYWAVVPKSLTTVPTAQQIIEQSSALAGYTFGSRQVGANYVDTITLTNLTFGAEAYNVYVVAKDASGMISPEKPTKLSIADQSNAMKVTYNASASSGEYPTYTTVTLTFAKDMFKKNSSLPMSFLSGDDEIKSCLTVTKNDVSTGTTSTVTDYVVTISSNRTLSIKPATQWSYGAVYTIEVTGLTSADNTAPTPAKTEFATIGAGSIVAAPTASKTSGASVYPGEKITLSTTTTGATIQYTDPSSLTGGYSYGSGSGVTIQIPSNAVSGRMISVTAVAFANGTYSQEVKFDYYVAYDAIVPQLVTSEGVAIPDGMTMAAGSTVYLTSSDPDSTVYFTISNEDDGSVPSRNSSNASGAVRTPIFVQGESGSTMYIKAFALKNNGGTQAHSSIVTFTINVAQSSGVGTPTAPVFIYGGQIVTSTSSPLPLSNYSKLTVSSYNAASTTLYYTTDGSDPRTSDTRMSASGSAEIAIHDGNQYRTIKAVARNQYGYSTVSEIQVYVYNPFA